MRRYECSAQNGTRFACQNKKTINDSISKPGLRFPLLFPCPCCPSAATLTLSVRLQQLLAKVTARQVGFEVLRQEFDDLAVQKVEAVLQIPLYFFDALFRIEQPRKEVVDLCKIESLPFDVLLCTS